MADLALLVHQNCGAALDQMYPLAHEAVRELVASGEIAYHVAGCYVLGRHAYIEPKTPEPKNDEPPMAKAPIKLSK